MKVLVTGGAGFIGSHLVEYHLGQGDEVWALDNFSTGTRDNLLPYLARPAFRLTEANLLTWEGLAEAVAWADTIYHMAAIVGQMRVLSHPIAVLSENIQGCERLLSYATPRTRILIASSSEVYRFTPETHFREEERIAFPSGQFLHVNYPLSKLVNEATALSYSKEKGLSIVVARLFNTTGTRQTGRYGMVVPRFIQQSLRGEPITVFGDGHQSRSFCNVHDTVRILSGLVQHPHTKGEIFNVGADTEISILALATLTKAVCKSPSPILFVPYEEAYGMPFEDTFHRCPNLQKLRQFLDLPPFESLEETLLSIAYPDRYATVGLT